MNSNSADRPSSRSELWIRDKKRFRLAMILTAALSVLSIPYPGTRPLYEEALLALRIPLFLHLPGGVQPFHYTGLLFIGGILWTLYLILNSLNRQRFLFCLFLVCLIPFLNKALLAGFLTLVPPGIYAVDLDQEQSVCHTVVQDAQISGGCMLVAHNHGSEAIDGAASVRIFYKGGMNRDTFVDAELDPVHLDPRGPARIESSFTVRPSRLEDLEGTSGISSALQNGNFLLTISDGRRERTWGRTWMTDRR
ncbi:hypothetical protein [Saccharibacillus alkalitolerans]|uniref:Uncharacterized protein n=1 Tax=Saccharibacillus alkalitolerans TaxID=2705290 RepID=A0ABX0F368_9BACL|nr:hypothetical protein [Saccharibacillus alkalitolerans]NGZ75047.1 hypothetical protein [Saccharibacillus alkalitolerans]